jgi:phospholipid/cholesterol/gamma-HCH transport system substrate-binding protein
VLAEKMTSIKDRFNALNDKRRNIKPLADRNRVTVGLVGIGIVVALVAAVFSYEKIPFLTGKSGYSAYFTEAGGIKPDSDVRVSGLSVGRVSSVKLDGTKVLVSFTVDDDVALGNRTEASIKTETVLGTKMLEITPRGDGKLQGAIPVERTRAPYDLPDALGDLTSTISALDTAKLSSALTTLANTFKDTPPDLKAALEGVAQFSSTLDNRDEKLRSLLTNANKVVGVLGKRSDQIANLVINANALLAELLTQRNAVDALMTNVGAATREISAVVGDNRTQLKPALDKLNSVLGVLDDRKKELQRTLYLIPKYAMSFGEVLGSGPFFKASLPNLTLGQFAQPFTDAAFSDLGLDPNVLLPSQLVDPGTGQPGLPLLPLPYPRTGQGGEPRRTIPDAITGKPGDQPCSVPGRPGAPGCYPLRPEPPAPPPGGPPPGPPADLQPPPRQTPVYQPAPNEVPANGGR